VTSASRARSRPANALPEDGDPGQGRVHEPGGRARRSGGRALRRVCRGHRPVGAARRSKALSFGRGAPSAPRAGTQGGDPVAPPEAISGVRAPLGDRPALARTGAEGPISVRVDDARRSRSIHRRQQARRERAPLRRLARRALRQRDHRAPARAGGRRARARRDLRSARGAAAGGGPGRAKTLPDPNSGAALPPEAFREAMPERERREASERRGHRDPGLALSHHGALAALVIGRR